MPPPRRSPRWPLDPHGYKPGYVEGRPSRVENAPPRAILRIYGAGYSLGYPFLPENQTRALRDARAIVKRLQNGEIPDPRVRRRVALPAEEPPAVVATFASSQAAFFRLKLQPRPGETDPRALRRDDTKRRLYRLAFKSAFPSDNLLTDATITAAIETWTLEPLGARRWRWREGKVGVDIYRRPLTRKSAEAIRDKLEIYIKFCIAKRWITVNPFDALDGPVIAKVLPPKVLEITPAERRALMRSVSIFARTPRARNRLQNLRQFPDFIRLLGLSGMRVGEAASLRLAEYAEHPERENVVEDDVILLYDTKRWRADKPTPPRIVSYRWFPELSAVIDRQRRHAARHQGYLWPWHTTSKLEAPRKWIIACIRQAGISGRVDPFHVWRSVANAHYHQLGLPLELVAKLLGHSPAINVQSYTDPRSVVAQNRAAIEADLARYLPGIGAASNPRPITTDQPRLLTAI